MYDSRFLITRRKHGTGDTRYETPIVQRLSTRGAVQDGDVLRMQIAELGPPLIVKIHDAQKRTWPRGIDQAFANMALGRR